MDHIIIIKHAVSLTIFSAIDNTEFVKFITEVQDKTAKLCHWQR